MEHSYIFVLWTIDELFLNFSKYTMGFNEKFSLAIFLNSGWNIFKQTHCTYFVVYPKCFVEKNEFQMAAHFKKTKPRKQNAPSAGKNAIPFMYSVLCFFRCFFGFDYNNNPTKFMLSRGTYEYF